MSTPLRRLVVLSPDLQRLVLEGRQRLGVTLRAWRQADAPLSRREQESWLRELAARAWAALEGRDADR